MRKGGEFGGFAKTVLGGGAQNRAWLPGSGAWRRGLHPHAIGGADRRKVKALRMGRESEMDHSRYRLAWVHSQHRIRVDRGPRENTNRVSSRHLDRGCRAESRPSPPELFDPVPTKNKFMRYSIDVWSILQVVGVLAFQVVAVFMDWSGWLFFPLILLLRQVNLVEHNHAHLRIFYNNRINDAFGWMCFMSNGVPLEFYEMHHVNNHHKHNNTDEDWSSIFLFEGCKYPDKPVGFLKYIWTFPRRTITSSLRGILAKPEARIYGRFWRSIAVISICSAGLIYVNPIGFIKFFAIPWWGIMHGLGFTSYRHHLDCEFTTPYDSSNVMDGISGTTLGFNIGFHVSHHIKPALHWSLLPAHHDTIKHLIPEHHFMPKGKKRDLSKPEASSP